MSKYIINGGKPLEGEVSIRGAKNASFKEIIATMLSSQTTTLTNIPKISDVKLTSAICTKLGSQIQEYGQHGLKITTGNISSNVIPKGTGEKSRTSFMFLAPLLARTGYIKYPEPGGDKLGKRPLDRLYSCLEKMGVSISFSSDFVEMKANKLIGVDYEFPKPSHTSTEVLLMISSLAEGHTTIRNSALEPEIDDLIRMLTKMGAVIYRDRNSPSTIHIEGKRSLSGCSHQIISDRNEIVTFACAALCTKGSISILRADPKTVSVFLSTITAMGAETSIGDDEIFIKWTKPLKAVNIETEPEPGFMTDWQAIFSLVLSQAVGYSQVIERVFPYRFQHIDILNQMGVKTKFFNPEIINPDTYYHFNVTPENLTQYHGVKIYGPTILKPSNIVINDLRAGATATIAALTAKGRSEIDRVEYIQRGYEKLYERFKSLGADIKYIKM